MRAQEIEQELKERVEVGKDEGTEDGITVIYCNLSKYDHATY